MFSGRTLPAGAFDTLQDEVSFGALGLLADFRTYSGLARLAFLRLHIPLLKQHPPCPASHSLCTLCVYRKSDTQQMHDLLSSRMPPQHVARFSQKEMQALTSHVRDGLTMKTAPRELLEKALPGKPALVDTIVTAFQMPGTAFG